jgi:hypothetical protein
MHRLDVLWGTNSFVPYSLNQCGYRINSRILVPEKLKILQEHIIKNQYDNCTFINRNMVNSSNTDSNTTNKEILQIEVWVL